MADKTWKAAERSVALLLGGRRVPITGRQRGDVPDVAHDSLSIEVKHRADLPGWLSEAMEQAEAAGKGNPALLPVAVIHRKHRPYVDSLCVIRLSDLARLLGEAP